MINLKFVQEISKIQPRITSIKNQVETLPNIQS